MAMGDDVADGVRAGAGLDAGAQGVRRGPCVVQGRGLGPVVGGGLAGRDLALDLRGGARGDHRDAADHGDDLARGDHAAAGRADAGRAAAARRGAAGRAVAAATPRKSAGYAAESAAAVEHPAGIAHPRGPAGRHSVRIFDRT